MEPMKPETRIEYLMTETYQFLITMTVLIGGGWVIFTNPTDAMTNLVSGLMGVVVTFWFGSRSAIGPGGAGKKKEGQ